MRILVCGAGAIGSVLGGFLRMAGHDVSCVGRPAHMAALRTTGLAIGGIWGDRAVAPFPAFDSVRDIRGPFDIILVTVKAYDTPCAARDAASLLGPASLMVSCQNGLGNLEAIAQVAGPTRTAGARVIFGAELDSPGRVRVTVYAEPVMIGPFAAGPPAWVTDLIHRLADALRAAGIPSGTTDAIAPYLWAKVLYNAPLNPLSAVLKATYGDLAADPATRNLMDQVIGEAYTVASARGVSLSWSSADDYRRLFYGSLVPSTKAHYASMLRDIERGKRTEIGAINGMVCRYGADAGIPTPVNGALVHLVTFLETRGRAPSQDIRP